MPQIFYQWLAQYNTHNIPVEAFRYICRVSKKSSCPSVKIKIGKILTVDRITSSSYRRKKYHEAHKWIQSLLWIEYFFEINYFLTRYPIAKYGHFRVLRGLTQRRNDVSLDELAAAFAFCAEQPLVIFAAVILAGFAEKPALRERPTALCALEALHVKVLVLNAQRVAWALLLAELAVNFAWNFIKTEDRDEINC